MNEKARKVPSEIRKGRYAENFRQTGCINPVRVVENGSTVDVLTENSYGDWSELSFTFGPAGIELRGHPALAPGERVPATDEELFRAEDARLRIATVQDRFSGVVLVGKNGAPVFQRAYGLADREARIPNRTETSFDIGSVTKPFTAVAIMQLVAEGKLEVHDPITRYLPELGRPPADRITIENLLTHTSGLGDVIGKDWPRDREKLRTPSDFVARFGREPLRFAPGSAYRYSNFGYIVLGRIVEIVSGQTYEEYVRKHVFEPAGMQNSDFADYDRRWPNHAVGYTNVPGRGWVESAPWVFVRGNPAGCAFASAPDLLSFATALLGGRLLDPASSGELMQGRVPLPEGEPSDKYGYGMGELWEDGARKIGLQGAIQGADAYFMMLPDLGYVVVALSNFDPPAADRVGARIVRLLIEMHGPSGGGRSATGSRARPG